MYGLNNTLFFIMTIYIVFLEMMSIAELIRNGYDITDNVDIYIIVSMILTPFHFE